MTALVDIACSYHICLLSFDMQK